jgi:hypothetical protein
VSAVEIAEDIEAIAHLDFDPKCDVIDVRRVTIMGLFWVDSIQRCVEPATCAIICRLCRFRSFCCDRHAHSGSEPSFCGHCKAEGPFDQLMLTVPLNQVRS